MQTCRVYKFYSTSVQSVTSVLSVFQRFLNCQAKRILIWRFRFIALDWMSVSREWFLRPMSRCVDVFTPVGWHTLIIYAPDWSLHVALAVNKTLEISQVGRPSVVNNQKKWVSNTKAGHTSRNLVNVGGFFFCRQDVSITIFGRTKEFSEVRGTSVMCNFGVRSRFLDVIYGVRPPNGSPDTGLQIYGGPGSLSHDFKIWPITFQGSGPCGPILLSCEKISLL